MVTQHRAQLASRERVRRPVLIFQGDDGFVGGRVESAVPAGARAVAWLLLLALAATAPQAVHGGSDAIVKTGLAPAELAGFDKLMASYVAQRNVPGVALAVVKDGRLVLARGYGWADREQKTRVRPDSKFRIASLSKSITAVAVLQLIQRNHLSLDTKIFALLELEQFVGDGQTVDPRLEQVTIGQLLRHTGGFDRRRSLDPMFHPALIARRLGIRSPAESRDVIRYMTTRSLDFAPGRHRAYSNFGYCLLGRAIEKVSGMSYASYVRRHVLRPLGMHHTRQGRTRPDGKAEGEVTYYAGGRTAPAVVGPIGQGVPRPYGAWYLEAMDANGAWVSSAVDMARFATAFDRPEHCPVLSADSVKTMFVRPADAAAYYPDGTPQRVYYACGWMVRPEGQRRATQWHGGDFDGTAAIMVRRPGRLNWVALFNTRYGPRGEQLADALAPHLDRVADAVKQWPGIDYFGRDELK